MTGGRGWPRTLLHLIGTRTPAPETGSRSGRCARGGVVPFWERGLQLDPPLEADPSWLKLWGSEALRFPRSPWLGCVPVGKWRGRGAWFPAGTRTSSLVLAGLGAPGVQVSAGGGWACGCERFCSAEGTEWRLRGLRGLGPRAPGPRWARPAGRRPELGGPAGLGSLPSRGAGLARRSRGLRAWPRGRRLAGCFLWIVLLFTVEVAGADYEDAFC